MRISMRFSQIRRDRNHLQIFSSKMFLKPSSEVDVNVDRKYYSLQISELRKMAHENGLNVDGSREMLIAAHLSI
jgi:hypothetical protein